MPELWADSLEGHRALVRRRLLDAFSALAATTPVDEITLTRVAERAGLARSAVYNYVGSKHDLLLEYTVDAATSWAERLTREGGGSVPERLQRFVGATLRTFADDPVAGHEDGSRLAETERERLQGALGPIRGHLRALLAEGLADGSVEGDLEELVTFVFATLSGYRRVMATGQHDPAVAAHGVARLLLDGLRPRG